MLFRKNWHLCKNNMVFAISLEAKKYSWGDNIPKNIHFFMYTYGFRRWDQNMFEIFLSSSIVKNCTLGDTPPNPEGYKNQEPSKSGYFWGIFFANRYNVRDYRIGNIKIGKAKFRKPGNVEFHVIAVILRILYRQYHSHPATFFRISRGPPSLTPPVWPLLAHFLAFRPQSWRIADTLPWHNASVRAFGVSTCFAPVSCVSRVVFGAHTCVGRARRAYCNTSVRTSPPGV